MCKNKKTTNCSWKNKRENGSSNSTMERSNCSSMMTGSSTLIRTAKMTSSAGKSSPMTSISTSRCVPPNDKGSLFICFIYTPISDFYGTIARRSKDKKRICFNRIFFTYMYPDGMTADAIEDHVWMDGADFASFAVGDSVSFYAEVYRYLKTGNGKQLAFGLRSPCGIRRCAPYALPSEKELRAQRMELSCCDNCYLGDCCSRVSCMLNRR